MAEDVTCKLLGITVSLAALAMSGAPHGQALPPPRDGDIRVLYWEIQKRTEVWLTLELRSREGKPLATDSLTFSIEFPGKRPARQIETVEVRANAGFMWAPKVELSFLVDGRENISVVPPGVVGLNEGVGAGYLPAELSLEVLARLARAKHIDGNALGLEFELTDFQLTAIRTFYERVLSDNPAAVQKHEQGNL